MNFDFNFFYYDFFWQAMLSATISGLLCGFIGPYLAWRNLGLMGASISHASLTPIAIASYFGIPHILLLFPFSAAISVWIGNLKERNSFGLDSLLAIIYSGFMAIGILILNFSENGSTEVVHYLFGDILFVSTIDFILLLSLFCFLLLFAYINRKPLLLHLINPEMAKLEYPQTKQLNAVSFCFIGLSVASSIKIMGILLMTILMMVPTLIVSKYSKSLKSHFISSSLLGALLACTGTLISFIFNLPSGATVASLATILFFALTWFK